nr:L-lactate dehydrogenase [Mycoplasma marinum]
MKTRKVALIGAGAVGTSFLYSAMNRGVAEEYGIIDINKEGAMGNKLDLEDASPTNFYPYQTEVYEYEDLKDVDVLVITAGRPQKPGETRIEMVSDNAKIMSFIANSVKKSGFSGITIIASNPVDVMTQVYQEVTGFDSKKVIGSGTALDSARLQQAIALKINVAPQSIEAYVMGEHGDSAVSAFSSAMVGCKPFMDYVESGQVDKAELPKIHESVWKKAYEIINRKRATFYGIGSALASLTDSVLRNTRKVCTISAKLEGEYGEKDLYIGVPAIIGSEGIDNVLEIPLNKEEKAQFTKSAKMLRETMDSVRKTITNK